jgi:lysophospholipase L1-like esterase
MFIRKGYCVVFATEDFYSRHMKNNFSRPICIRHLSYKANLNPGKWFPVFLSTVAALFLFGNAESFGQGSNAPTINIPGIENTATNPVPRDAGWLKRHESFVAIAKNGGVDLLFLGDSITDFWRNRGSNVWNQYYAPRHAANFGISGDRTQHVLWRMDHGELDGIKPRVVVLLIGTNNTGKERDKKAPRNSPAQVVEGVTAVVRELRVKLPDSKILLLAIFPRGDGGPDQQAQINEINPAIARLADGRQVVFLDIGSKFLDADGRVSEAVMPGLLHPNAKGYQIWAEAMNPTLEEMLK